MNISICRKIFATFMKNEGVEQEMIDLLQCRILKLVFVRHYYRADVSNFDEISEKLTRLHDLIANRTGMAALTGMTLFLDTHYKLKWSERSFLLSFCVICFRTVFFFIMMSESNGGILLIYD